MWDDPTVDWDRFDLVVLRSTWDYAERHGDFLAWARSLPRVANEPAVLEWNVDKRYLDDLPAVVDTTFVAPGAPFEAPPGRFVVKPSISAGGRSSALFEPDEHSAAQDLVARIQSEGRTAMVQPYVDGEEKALVYIDGRYSHALRRRVPLPSGGDRTVLFLDEHLAPAEATPDERATAEAALARVPGEPLYARVDLLAGLVLELEVVEPSLYLGFGPGSGARFASAIARRLAA